MALSPDLKKKLESVTTATLTTVLLKKGIRSAYLKGPMPLRTAEGKRIVGEAFTLRFVPMREDLATPESWSSPRSTRGAIEDMPEGCIAVVDAMGVTSAGLFGGMLCARIVLGTGLPVWCQGAAAPASVPVLTFVNWQEPIGCGGVAVFPGDIIVADGDGAVLIPRALLEAVVDAAVEQERLEEWIMKEVDKGVPLPGLYPPNAETKARYEAETKK